MGGMAGRGRRVAILMATLGVATIFGTAVALRNRGIEQWYLWKLESPDKETREAAAKQLGEMRSARAVVLLLEKLGTSDSREERFTAYDTFFALSGVDRDFAAKAIVDAVLEEGDQTPSVVNAGVGRLVAETIWGGAIGNDCIARGEIGHLCLARFLVSDPEPKVREWAARALVNCRPEAKGAVEALIRGLGDAHPGVRENSAFALGFIERRALPAIPRLMPLVDDPDPKVRAQVLWCLCKLGASGDERLFETIATAEMVRALESRLPSLEGETIGNARSILERASNASKARADGESPPK
jgi:HEAT repeat protein